MVTEGQILFVDKLITEESAPVKFANILLIKDKTNLEIGTPLVSGLVKGTVLSQTKGKKIQVSKFKAKTGYRKKIGFRPLYTRVKIDEISFVKEKKEKVA